MTFQKQHISEWWSWFFNYELRSESDLLTTTVFHQYIFYPILLLWKYKKQKQKVSDWIKFFFYNLFTFTIQLFWIISQVRVIGVHLHLPHLPTLSPCIVLCANRSISFDNGTRMLSYCLWDFLSSHWQSILQVQAQTITFMSGLDPPYSDFKI